MLVMVTIVSGSVHFYSIGYMRDDVSISRFISYLSLFTFFMFILVTGDNFVQLFLGWEGIGLCSYLLISFWNSRVQANKSALKALILNRIGDFGFLCGLVLIFYFFRSVDFTIVFTLAPFFSDIYFIFLGFEFSFLDTVCFFLFLGSMGKSAQIGLHTWLPDAMEGPTPVSALIHAATLVTAGVFLIIRCSPLFELAPCTLFFILLIGGLTAFFAATVAITQDDIKKVIAYSTCSQLGYMVFICGLSSYNIAIFHLINHAFFKALLFLGAGSVIHAMSGEQDMRKYGQLVKLTPYTYNMLFVGCLALVGFPFLSGFYSKDLILEMAFSNYSINGIFIHWLGSVSAGLTAFYSFRVLYYTF
jgi:proton-translocating NADH-quinone oxidoreductase chain L